MNNQILTPEMHNHHSIPSPSTLSLPTLLNNLPGMAYRCQNDEQWTMDFVSGGAEALTGYPATALINNHTISYAELIAPADRSMVSKDVQTALNERRPFQITYRIHDAQGKEKWVWEQGQGIFGEDDTLQAIEGFITDITTLHQTEAALRESEARFRTLIQSAKDGVILGNEKGLIVGWNKGASNIFGYEEEEILGKPISLLMPERYQESHQRGMNRLTETGEGRVLGRTVEMHGRRKDGSEFPLEIALNSWLAPDGSRFFNGMVRDITERKAVEVGLVEYTKQLQTAADLAQQINNILDPELLLQEIVQQLQTRFSLYHVHVYLLDQTGEDLVVRAGSGDAGSTLVANQHRIAIQHENSLVAQAARSREIVNVADVRNSPTFLANILLPDTRSEVAVPLVASSQLIGVLDIQDNIINRFSTSELDVFRALSGQIATTLENSKLFRQVEGNLAETQSRLLVAEALSSAESEEEVLEALVQQGGIYRDTMLAVALWVPTADVPTLVMHRSASFESGIPAFREGTLFTTDQFLVPDGFSATESFIANNISEDPRFNINARTMTDEMGAKSVIAIPLTVRGEWLGALVLISQQVDYFDEHKLLLYRALAEQGAEALVRARLRATAQEAQVKATQERGMLNQIMANLPVGVFVADPTGVPILTNEAARQLLGRGIDPQAGAGQYVEMYDITQENGTPYPTEGLPLVKTLTDQGSYAKDDIFIKHTDGKILNIFVNSAPLYTPDQEFMGGVVSFTDISSQREALEERSRYTRQLQTAAELAGRIASILDLDELLIEVVSELQSRFDLYHVHIYLVDEANQQLVMAQGSGTVGAILRKQGHQIPLNREQSLVARAARNRELVVVHDVQATPDFLPNPLLPDTRSEVSVPLVVAGKVLGVLDVQDNTPERFTQGDLDVFRTLSGLVATALQNADLFQQVQANLAQTNARYKVAVALASAESESEILDAIIREGGIYADTQLTLAFFEPNAPVTTYLIARSASFESVALPFEEGALFPINEYPIIEFFSAQEPFVAGDIANDDRADPNAMALGKALGFKSLAVVPLKAGNEWIGSLVVTSPQAHFFDSQKAFLYNTLAEQGSEAITRARLRAANATLLTQVEINLAETENRLRVSQALANVESEAEVLNAIIHTGGFYRDTMLAIALWVKDAETPTVEVVRSNPFDSGMPAFPDGVQFTVAQFPMIALLNDTEPFVSANIQHDERVSESSRMAAQMMGQQGAAIIPMKVSGEWVGGLVVASTYADYFDARKLSLYLALANQGADAMTRARLRAANDELFHQVETNLAETENRLRVSEALAEAETEAEVLDALMETGGFYRDTLLAIAFWVKDAEELTAEVIRANPYDSGMPVYPIGGRFTAVESPLIGLLNDTEPFVSTNIQQDIRVGEGSRIAAQMMGQQGAAIIPMNVAGQWIGGLVVVSTHENYFDERKMSLYRALADQGSEALTRARLRATTTQALEALQNSESRYRTLADNSADMISRHNEAGDYVYVSPSVTQLLGYQPEEVIGRNAYEFIVQDDQSTIRASHDLQLQDENSQSNLYRLRRADGTATWVESLSQSVFDENGNLKEIVVVTRGMDTQVAADEERRRYTRQLQTAAELAGRINTILDLDELLTETVSELQAQFDLYHVHIYLRDEVGNNLVMLKGSGTVGQTLRERNHAIAYNSERSLVARAARSQNVVVVNDTALEEGFLPNPLLPDTQSEVAIPLVSAGRVLGVLDVQDNEAHRFTQAELDVLRTLAGLIATSLQNAELYQQVEQSLQETRLRLKVSQVFASTQSEQEVRDTIFDLVAGLGKAQINFFTVNEEDGERYSTLYRTYAHTSNARPLPIGLRLKWNDFAMSKFIESRDTLFVTANAFEDSRVDESIRALLMQTGAVSFGVIPIRVDKELYAVITTSSPEANAFSEEDIQLYQIVAERGALATREARLYDAVQESLTETTKRLQVSQAFTGTRGENEVLETIFNLAKEVDQVQVTLFTHSSKDGDEISTVYKAVAPNDKSRPLSTGMSFKWSELQLSKVWDYNNAPFVTGNSRHDERVDESIRHLNQHTGIVSFAIIPFRTEQQTYATLSVASTEENYFDAEKIHLYEVIAERGALALREARLYDQVQLSLKRTNIRFAVSQALAHARTEEDVLDALIYQSSFISGAHVTISTFDPTAEVATLVTRRSANFESPVPAFPLGLRFTRAEFPIQALLRPDEAFVSNDLHNDPRVDAATLGLAQALGIASGGLFPLTNGGELVGVVNVLSEERDFFADPASTYLYESLAEQGSVALRAARLFDETQETAERLKELDRLKSEFLANMSHELRTPLNSIIGYAEIMLMGINGDLSDDNLEDVNAIRTSGQHLLRLINDILDLAKIEAGRMTLDTEEVNLPALLDEIRVAHLALIHKKDIQLHVAIEPLGLTIQADRLRLNQILTNLISNAVKFTEKGHVLVRAKQDNEEWMRIEVEDTGVGIDPENLEAIFEEFRQADGSSTRRAEGTGLGLAITRRLVQMHGGIITVESTVNKGSTFTVRLPIHTMASYLN